jgi:MFS transporter, PHS family, inorganic phosphate transporter
VAAATGQKAMAGPAAESRARHPQSAWDGFLILARNRRLLIRPVTTHAWPFILLYGISYFFTEFGPNTTTLIYPAEIFPVEVRTTGHGISAGAGKLGAFAGAFLFQEPGGADRRGVRAC